MDQSFLSWVEEHQLEDYFDLQLQSESGSTTSELPTATEQLENADFLPGVQPLLHRFSCPTHYYYPAHYYCCKHQPLLLCYKEQL